MKTTTALACLSLALLLPGRLTWAGLFDTETKLTSSDAAALDRFGESVSISGNRAIIGAAGDDDAGDRSGSAYLFDATTGDELFKLAAAVGHAQFGHSVAISGNTAIVGANRNNGAYLFDVTTGSQLLKLTTSDTVGGDRFGESVAVSGNIAIVGADLKDDAGNNSGSAYLFDVTTGNELFKLTASDAAAHDWFGHSVAISDNRAIVGAPRTADAGGPSAAYLFDADPLSSTFGDELFNLTGKDTVLYDLFGWAVSISGNRAIIGAPGNDDAGSNSGSAYLFDVTTGEELFKLTASDAAKSGNFGTSVAISGNTAIVGNAGGSAYLFNVTTGNELLKLYVAVDEFGYSVSISGNTAIVGAIGDESAYLFSPEPSALALTIFGFLLLVGSGRRKWQFTS